MEIERPTWQTRQICPDCGQGNPTFYYCTKCGFVTLQCQETGDTFKNAKNLEEGFVDKCPNCGQENTVDFETADLDKILNAGFKKEDYE
jgi:hypothetical protein